MSPAAPALQADSLLLSLLGSPHSGRVTTSIQGFLVWSMMFRPDTQNITSCSFPQLWRQLTNPLSLRQWALPPQPGAYRRPLIPGLKKGKCKRIGKGLCHKINKQWSSNQQKVDRASDSQDLIYLTNQISHSSPELRTLCLSGRKSINEQSASPFLAKATKVPSLESWRTGK